VATTGVPAAARDRLRWTLCQIFPRFVPSAWRYFWRPSFSEVGRWEIWGRWGVEAGLAGWYDEGEEEDGDRVQALDLR
jgi:hypothetical protein